MQGFKGRHWSWKCGGLEKGRVLKMCVVSGLFNLRIRTGYVLGVSRHRPRPWLWRSSSWRAQCRWLRHGWHSQGIPSEHLWFLHRWAQKYVSLHLGEQDGGWLVWWYPGCCHEGLSCGVWRPPFQDLFLLYHVQTWCFFHSGTKCWMWIRCSKRTVKIPNIVRCFCPIGQLEPFLLVDSTHSSHSRHTACPPITGHHTVNTKMSARALAYRKHVLFYICTKHLLTLELWLWLWWSFLTSVCVWGGGGGEEYPNPNPKTYPNPKP